MTKEIKQDIFRRLTKVIVKFCQVNIIEIKPTSMVQVLSDSTCLCLHDEKIVAEGI
jgi:hypothetical protein